MPFECKCCKYKTIYKTLNCCKVCKKRYIVICKYCENNKIHDKHNKILEWGNKEIKSIEKYLDENPKHINKLLAGFIFKEMHHNANFNS